MDLYTLLETNRVPDFLIRLGIRRMLAEKLRFENESNPEKQQARLMAFINHLKQSPIAIETDAANNQHYEVPSRFFDLVLGPRRKYSCCYWHDPTTGNPITTLKQAEETMLTLTCARAEIEDGQTILDLGCGWGSLSLWLAEKYPKANITGFSNSTSQKAFIDEEALRQGFTNLKIVTGNIVTFENFGNVQFDRIVSIEMFEHMKNYELLLDKVSRWLNQNGKLFIHIFTHQRYAYHYQDTDGTDWLTRYFFTGGTMPSNDLLLYFQNQVCLEKHWIVDGTHYQKTADAWLKNMSTHQDAVLACIHETYGKPQTKRWWVYWRLFFMACSELWGYHQGREWIVSHYLFNKK